MQFSVSIDCTRLYLIIVLRSPWLRCTHGLPNLKHNPQVNKHFPYHPTQSTLFPEPEDVSRGQGSLRVPPWLSVELGTVLLDLAGVK